MDLTRGSDGRPGGQRLLGQTAGRTKKGSVTWLEELSQDWRDGIKIVVMDPCATYRRAVEAGVGLVMPCTISLRSRGRPARRCNG